MQTARIFTNGNSQAVRLPKEFRFDTREVVIKKVGDVVMLLPLEYSERGLCAMLDDVGPLGIERDQTGEEESRDWG